MIVIVVCAFEVPACAIMLMRARPCDPAFDVLLLAVSSAFYAMPCSNQTKCGSLLAPYSMWFTVLARKWCIDETKWGV
jgi:hypothetical protein